MLKNYRNLSGLFVVPIALAPLLLSLAAVTDTGASGTASRPPTAPQSVAEMEVRAAVLAHDIASVEDFYAREVEPIERILRPFNDDDEWVRRIAFSLVQEGRKARVDPRVLASVVLVENPWLDAEAASSQGAVGLMQVMPFHAGQWDCASSDLTDPDANVCHGARIFRHYLARARGDLDKALLAYNGCVTGSHTPDCHLYPSHVYSSAGREVPPVAVPLPMLDPEPSVVPGVGAS